MHPCPYFHFILNEIQLNKKKKKCLGKNDHGGEVFMYARHSETFISAQNSIFMFSRHLSTVLVG